MGENQGYEEIEDYIVVWAACGQYRSDSCPLSSLRLVIMHANCPHTYQRADATKKSWVCEDCGTDTKPFGMEAESEQIAPSGVDGELDQ